MAYESPNERQIQLERRFQSVVLSVGTAVLSAGIGYVSVQIHEQGKQIHEQGTSLAVTAFQVNEVSEKMKDMYRSVDAKRDVSEMTVKIDANSHRIQLIEGRQNNFDLRLDRVERVTVQKRRQ